MTSKPTLNSLYDQIRVDLSNSLNFKQTRYSLVNIVSKPLAAVAFSLYCYIDSLAKNLLPDSASKEILERWSAIWGIYRKSASFASGLVKFEGVEGSKIPADIRLQDSEGRVFTTLTESTILEDQAIAPVKAEEAGLPSNLPSLTPLTLINPISGITGAMIHDQNLSGGSDIESDPSLRSRLLSRIRNPPQGGAPQDYINWAREIPGVTRAWVFPRFHGPGSVGVAFVLDKQEDIIPDSQSEKFEEVEQNIYNKAPITAKVLIFPPKRKGISMRIKVVPDTEEVRKNVRSELKDLFYREAGVGGAYKASSKILISRVREAISTAEGEFDHQLISPVDTITLEKGEIAILGDIEWI